MENLNAEQIKKALECCSSSDGVSACESGCPYWGGDYDTCPCIEEPNFIIKNALALINSQEQRIKELTEENERLTTAITLWAKQCVELEKRCMKLGADIVTKMQEALEQRIHSKLSYYGWYLKETVIAAIAKEMLEGE